MGLGSGLSQVWLCRRQPARFLSRCTASQGLASLSLQYGDEDCLRSQGCGKLLSALGPQDFPLPPHRLLRVPVSR